MAEKNQIFYNFYVFFKKLNFKKNIFLKNYIYNFYTNIKNHPFKYNFFFKYEFFFIKTLLFNNKKVAFFNKNLNKIYNNILIF